MSATHTLFYAAASPFVRKVLVLLHETGQRERVALEEVTPTPVAPIRQLNASNPAGKIPALRLPDGQVLHDSRVICDYFDQQHVGEPLIPREGSARWRRLTIASLADAVLDAAVLTHYETFVRPEEKRWDAWLEAQREKIARSLAWLESDCIAELQARFDIAAIGVACALGYLDLRQPEWDWRGEWIVPAVEGYAASLPPLGHYQLPVQSLLVATEPLPSSVWAEIGLERGQAFSEFSRQVTYGQRTADDRLAFGARGGYRFGGKLRSDFSLDDEEVGLRRYLFGELFPLLKDARISHTWGGNLGMARRFRPHMLLDRASGIALSGGYGGEGVGASNLGGRTLAALILGEDSELLRQPWVLGERPLDSLARWEPEPCRWLGYNAIIRSFVHEDRVLADPHSAPWRRSLAQTLAAGMESLMR